jgi:prolyl oligopeptidase PreP (S9A serine peptidase family)
MIKERYTDILAVLEVVEIKNYPNLVTLHGGSDGGYGQVGEPPFR